MQMNHILPGLLMMQTVSMLCGGTAQAEEHAHRQHEAHAHGVAQLNIAIEDQRLHIELSSPAMNLVGFEHTPRNEKEKQHVQQAVAILKQAAPLFELTPAAQCKPVSVDVDSSLIAGEHGNHDGYATTHADFRAEYVFECQQVSVLTSMTVGLFKKFPATHDINVRLLTEKGQTAMELNAKSTRIDF